jgi:subtilisin family serine protease
MYRIATLLTALLLTTNICPQSRKTSPTETLATGHLVIVYRNHTIPANADAIAASIGARATHLPLFGLSTLHITGDENAAIIILLAQPEVLTVLHDRYVTAHALIFPQKPMASPATLPIPLPLPPISIPRPKPPIIIAHPIPTPAPATTDTYYDSPQGWAVLQAGGFGDNVPGGSSTGPWTTSLGAGVRIAILDSGVDANHPDIAPNLAFNLTEIDQTALPSACDDGSPQDQQGHGTWTASLAAAAIGGGNVIGVAPQATLLNIKVLERLPATTGTTLTSQCEAGEATGLLSWVLEGIAAAVAQHANVISLSLGTLVDTTTGDGAGWQAQFNAATYAAAQSGVVIVAALGNDGLNLSGTLIELPAQARDVLPVTASTNPACAENLASNATCTAGPVTRTSYSNFGVANAIAAPGGDYPQGIGLTQPTAPTGFVTGACSSGLANTTDGLPSSGQSFGCFNLGHNAYIQAIGTSAAAPLVAGAAAILHAAHPTWTAAQLISALQSSATRTTTMVEPELNLPTALAMQ